MMIYPYNNFMKKQKRFTKQQRIKLPADERVFRYFYEFLLDLIQYRYNGSADELIFEYSTMAFYIGKRMRQFECIHTRNVISRWSDIGEVKVWDITNDDLTNFAILIGVIDEVTAHNRYTATEMANKMYEFIDTKPAVLNVYEFAKYVHGKQERV